MAAKFEPLARPTSPKMDAILGKQFGLLDHGFIRVIDYMGDDAAIVQAARVSYGSGTKTLRQDEGLIRYLLRHQHTTPFEMCEIKLHIKLPIFVARQWIRHRTANVNEYSARYSVLDKEFYVPDIKHLNSFLKKQKVAEQSGQESFLDATSQTTATAPQSATNKQGRGEAMPAEEAQAYIEKIREISSRCYTAYERLLNGEKGLSRELARMVLPTNFYTQWFWKVDLHNLLRFLSLRAHSHAQYEIRVYAEELIKQILPRWVPAVANAFEEYQRGAFTLSKSGAEVVRKRLGGDTGYVDKSMSGRETEELNKFFEPQKRE